jgi:hypothetical protein
MDTTGLNLTVPKREPPPPRPSRSIPLLLGCLLLAVLADIGIDLWRPHPPSGTARPALDAEARKQLALKLERQRLHAAGAQAWRDYLRAADLDSEQVARIWYRIGILYQDADDYANALDAFYRSESFATIDGIDTEIGRRTSECLEALGKFAALRDELARRTAVDEDAPAPGDAVLAEIGGMQITRVDLERRMEQQIEQQLTQLAAFMPDEERDRQKEAMLKQLADAQGRARFLGQVVMEELLYRKAREEKLADDPDVRAALRSRERALLAAQVMQRELAARIRITPGDLQTYYEAHKTDYVEKTEAEGEEGEAPTVTERQMSFDEARDRVYVDLRTRKEREVQERLMAELRQRYDVVIHQSALGTPPASDSDASQ